MALFDRNLSNLWYLKCFALRTLLLCLHHPCASCSAPRPSPSPKQKNNNNKTKKKTSKNTRGISSCHSYAMLLITVLSNRRRNQNHGSRRIKYFLISWRIISDRWWAPVSENHGSRLLMKSQFTRKNHASHFTFHGKKIRPLKNHENTFYRRRQLDNSTTRSSSKKILRYSSYFQPFSRR